MTTIDRGQWARCLNAAPKDQVKKLAHSLVERYPRTHRRLPQSGLGMLQLREPNRGERFHLGEIPLAAAEVSLRDENGTSHPGAAMILLDDQELAEALAICDAALAADLPGSESVTALIHEGHTALREEQRQRSGILHRTSVAFDLLEEEDD